MSVCDMGRSQIGRVLNSEPIPREDHDPPGPLVVPLARVEVSDMDCRELFKSLPRSRLSVEMAAIVKTHSLITENSTYLLWRDSTWKNSTTKRPVCGEGDGFSILAHDFGAP